MIARISLPNSTSWARCVSGGNDPNELMTHKTVHRGVDLVLEVAALALAELDGIVNQTLVSRLVRRGQNQRGVGGGILRLVDIDSCPMRIHPLGQSI